MPDDEFVDPFPDGCDLVRSCAVARWDIDSVRADRSMAAAMIPAVAIERATAEIDALEDFVGASWSLFGLRSAGGDTALSLTGMVAVDVLVPTGSVHPVPALMGRHAPAENFGLIFRSEDRRPGSGGSIELCRYVCVLADGRWFTRERVRGENLGPLRETAGAGAPTGRISEALSRVLGLGLALMIDPREVAVRVLARMAVSVAVSGHEVGGVIGFDPVVLAGCARAAETGGDGGDLLSLAVADGQDRLSAGGVDWVAEQELKSVSDSDLLTALAGVARSLIGWDRDVIQWWGTEALVARLAEAAGPVDAALEELARINPGFAGAVSTVIEQRRRTWNLPGAEAREPLLGML
jgi:hypothetical protein